MPGAGPAPRGLHALKSFPIFEGPDARWRQRIFLYFISSFLNFFRRVPAFLIFVAFIDRFGSFTIALSDGLAIDRR